jgi:VanZ family protein
MPRHLTYWLPPIAWAAMILAASSDVFSTAHTGGWIEIVISWLGRSLSPTALDLLNQILRKLGHVTAYGILSALWFRALRGERSRWNPQWAIGAIVLTALVASVDEYHQSFIPSRTGTWHDVVLDTSAAIVVQITIRAAQVLLFRST